MTMANVLEKIENLLESFGRVSTTPLSIPTHGKVEAGSEGISSWLNNLGRGQDGCDGSRLARPISQGHSPASAAESVSLHHVKDRLLKFVAGEPDDNHSLVNWPRLREVGVDPEIVASVFGKLQNRGAPCTLEDRVELLGLALYMNTLALPEAARLGLYLALYHEKKVGRECEEEEEEDEEDVPTNLAFLSKKQVLSSCRRHLKDHTTAEATGRMMASNAEAVMDLVDEAVACRVFDSEVFLTEYVHGFHLPRVQARAFAEYVRHHEINGHVIDVDPAYRHPDVVTALSKNVAGLEDAAILKNDAFRYALPQRYHVKNGCTEAMMDAVLDQVACVPFEDRGPVYEAVNFTRMTGKVETSMLHLKALADAQFEEGRTGYAGLFMRACAVAMYLSILRMSRPTEWPFYAASAKDTMYAWDDVDSRRQKKNSLFYELDVFYMISERRIYRCAEAWPLLSRYICDMNE